ncbi:MAG: hypothetical protein Q4B73_02335 [Lachnospiraceae bacterium]|nr:hypothetical protein [Lachnospiraceae bacterium]
MKIRGLLAATLIAAMVVPMMGGCGYIDKIKEAKEMVQSGSKELAEAVKEAAGKKVDEAEKAEVPEEDPVDVAEEPMMTEEASSEHPQIILENHYKTSWDPVNYNTKARISYYAVKAESGTEKTMPRFVESLADVNEMMTSSSESYFDELLAEYESMAAEGTAPEGEAYLTNEDTVYVMRADEEVFSMVYEEYFYLGGPHPNTSYVTVTLDAQTGSALAIEDVVTDVDGFLDILDQKLQEDFPDAYAQMSDPVAYFNQYDLSSPDGYPFTLDSEGMTVYIAAGEIASYAAGEQLVRIGFDEFDGFAPAYCRTKADEYVMPLLPYQKIKVDVDNDGTKEAVSLGMTMADGGYYMRWHINVDDETLIIDDDTYNADAYVVRADGHYFMYLFESGEDDYRFMRSIDLATLIYDPDDVTRAGMASWWKGGDNTDDISEGVAGIYALTDPSYMWLSGRCDMLSTQSTYMIYDHENGKPKAVADYYLLRAGNALKAKTDVTCDVVDSNGDVIGTDTIPAGTVMAFARTDGSTWVDLQIIGADEVKDVGNEDYHYYQVLDPQMMDPNKTTYRFYPDHSDYPYQVNGVAEEELFDGVMYAG